MGNSCPVLVSAVVFASYAGPPDHDSLAGPLGRIAHTSRQGPGLFDESSHGAETLDTRHAMLLCGIGVVWSTKQYRVFEEGRCVQGHVVVTTSESIPRTRGKPLISPEAAAIVFASRTRRT
jgi:hypothetical protein